MIYSRRQFFAGAVAAFAFRNETIDCLARLTEVRGSGEPNDEEFWMQIRNSFDIDPELTAFNHCGLSPSPRATREAIAEQTKRANFDPSLIIWRQQDNELDAIRKQLSELVGCETEELALTMNATYGLQTTIMGVPMVAGDEILATNHEYSRGLTAIRQRERRDGIKPVIVSLDAPLGFKKDLATQILDRVTAKTRLIVLSQMTFLTGSLMPIKEIAASVADRGIPVLMDAAHGIGLLPEKFSAAGAEIYTACLHKWMMAPIGTGVFVVKRSRIKKIWPLHPAEESLDGSMRKFEQIGTRPAAPFLAIKESLNFHNLLGRERKAARLETLRNRLANYVLNAQGVKSYSSLDPERDRVMLAFEFEKADAVALAGWLLGEHKIHVTTVVRAGLNAIRISPNVFTTFSEIDRLGVILNKVARQGI